MHVSHFDSTPTWVKALFWVMAMIILSVIFGLSALVDLYRQRSTRKKPTSQDEEGTNDGVFGLPRNTFGDC